MKAKFLELFQVLHLVGSQVYKLELPKQWRIYNVFYISLLEQDTTKKGQVDKKTAEQLEFEAGGDDKEYKVEGICNSAIYTRKSEAGHLPGLYYLVSWKRYLKDKNTREFILVVQYHRKLGSTFYKSQLNT